MISRRGVLAASLLLAGGAGFPACAAASLNDRLRGAITGVHDPSIIREGNTYYLFSTTLAPQGDPRDPQIPCRVSRDLLNWKLSGYVFPSVPSWAMAAIPGIRDIWAPDITHFAGLYWLYYACSTGGSNRSAIGLATTPTLDPSSPHHLWTDHGLVLESREPDDFNAIDPAHIVDRQGRRWLAFGSFWSGLKMVALDRETGKPAAGRLRLESLAQRLVPDGAPDTIEAPFLFERNGWYYLLASY